MHDVDFIVAEPDAEAAAATLSAAGFDHRAHAGELAVQGLIDGAVVDVLHRINGVPVDKDLVRSGSGDGSAGHPDAGVVRDARW